MNVYDFDNTIYKGESVIDFFWFCLGKNPKLIRLMPFTFFMLVRYKMGRISVAELEAKAVKYAAGVFCRIDELEALISEFWDKHQHKIKEFYLKQQHPDDVIISASCSFLLNEICRRIGVRHCLCSEIDTKTGAVLQVCFRGNKPEIFREHFPNAVIDRFYTDSKNDLPMIALAKKAYLVKGSKIAEITKGE